MARLTPRRVAVLIAAALVALSSSSCCSPVSAKAAEVETIVRGDGTQEPTRANLGSIPGVQEASAALHGAAGSSSSDGGGGGGSGGGGGGSGGGGGGSGVSSSSAASTSSTTTTNSSSTTKNASSSSSVFTSYPFPSSLRLGHWDPPTSGCKAALLDNPAYSQVPQPDGSIRFYLPWTTWPCMNGAKVRTFLTAQKSELGGGDGDKCRTLDAGFEISTWALSASNLPTAAQANACRPPHCAHFGGAVNGTLCQQPFIRDYFDMPAAGTHFQPFEVAQLDWEPEGHAPLGVYSDPHLDLHFYYTSKAAIEAIGVGSCNRYGFLSQEAWFRALKPVPIQCFPTGAYTNTALAVSGMGTHLVNVLSPEFKPPFHGFGQTLILGSYDGAINFVELMASAHWLEANAAAGKKLCFPIIGSPKEYRYGGLKPHKYCFEPDGIEGPESITAVRFTDLLWFEPGCVEDEHTVYAPDSFAPPIQEAILLNPTCTFPKPGGINATAEALEGNKTAAATELRETLAAALSGSAARRPPLVAAAAANAYVLDRAATSLLAEGYSAFREPKTLSNSNGRPYNATMQKEINRGMFMTMVG